MKKITLAAALLLATTSVSANAAIFNFIYLLNGNTLEGQVEGILQADNDTVVVSQLLSSSYNLNVGIPLPFLGSGASYANAVTAIDLSQLLTGTPKLSLSGNNNDFLACNNVVCDDGFAFVPSPNTFLPFPLVASGITYGQTLDLYNAQNWSMSLANPVPEPASWAMLIAGFGLTGAAMRRRRAVVAA